MNNWRETFSWKNRTLECGDHIKFIGDIEEYKQYFTQQFWWHPSFANYLREHIGVVDGVRRDYFSTHFGKTFMAFPIVGWEKFVKKVSE
jgi:hypothetical protein